MTLWKNSIICQSKIAYEKKNSLIVSRIVEQRIKKFENLLSTGTQQSVTWPIKEYQINGVTKKGNSDIDGIVRQRMKYFEDLLTSNKEQSDYTSNTKYYSNKFFPDSAKTEDFDEPDKPQNTLQMCRSQDNFSDSFSKVLKSHEMIYEEDEAIMRLKASEREHSRVQKYQSFLNAPLTQHAMVYKYEGGLNKSSRESIASIKSLHSQIEIWNKKGLSYKEKENMIDTVLPNSIHKTNLSSSSPVKALKMLQLTRNTNSPKWIDMDSVKSKDLEKTLSRNEVIFQEIQFELISSEASYYKSLNILVEKFYNSPLLSLERQSKNTNTLSLIKAHQKEHLFSNILEIHSISGKFLADLEKRFTITNVMKNVCDIVIEYAKGPFKAYVPYIQNQKFQTEEYNNLKKNDYSARLIEQLESQPECCNLSLDSFLILPMQRLLRILLLLKRIKENIPEKYMYSKNSVDEAISLIEKIINESTEKCILLDERQRMLEISRGLAFKPGQSNFTISSGILLHEGEVGCHKKAAGIKNCLSTLRKEYFDRWLILTNEYLLITNNNKAKEFVYLVEDWCMISKITVQTELKGKQPDKYTSSDFSITFEGSNRYVITTKSRKDCLVWTKKLTDGIKAATSNALC